MDTGHFSPTKMIKSIDNLSSLDFKEVLYEAVCILELGVEGFAEAELVVVESASQLRSWYR